MRITITRNFFKNIRRNGRRKLIILAGIAVIHGVVIYGFVTVEPKNIHEPLLVFTEIVTDPSIIPYTFYEATPTPACVQYRNAEGDNPAPLPHCSRPTPPPLGYEQLGDDGYIQLDLTLDAQGKITAAQVSHSSNQPHLDQAAITQIQSTWQFQPCNDSQGAACTQRIKFRWQRPEPVKATP